MHVEGPCHLRCEFRGLAARNKLGLLLLCAAGHDADDALYRERLGAALADLNKEASGTSQRVTRAIIMRRPPSFDSGEITEKGSLNARLIRERRSDLVEALYADSHPDVFRVS